MMSMSWKARLISFIVMIVLAAAIVGFVLWFRGSDIGIEFSKTWLGWLGK